MSESNLPVRVVEGEWRYDRRRYIDALPALDAPTTYVFAIVAIKGTLEALSDMRLAIAYAALWAIVGGRKLWQRRNARRLVQALRADVDPGRTDFVKVVKVSFAREGHLYGEDAGALYIDGHTVHFEGTQTMFSFPASRLDARGRFLDRPEYSITFEEIAKPWRWKRKFEVRSDAIHDRIATCTPDPDATELVVALPPVIPMPSYVESFERPSKIAKIAFFCGPVLAIAALSFGWNEHTRWVVLIGVLMTLSARVADKEATEKAARFRKWMDER